MLDNLPELWKHQREGIELAKDRQGFAFLWDPGVGKSRALLEVLRYKFNKHKCIFPTLIFAPVIVLENWKAEFKKFTKIDLKKVIVLSGPTKKRIQLIEKAELKYGDSFIAVTNYEGIVASKDFFGKILSWAPQVVVIDESQKIKNPTSKRTKAVTAIADQAKYKFLLTGTPVLNTPMDIYAQYRAMDNGETFGRNFYIFRSEFFYDKNAGMPKDKHFPDWVVRKGAYELLNQLIYTKATRAVKSDCLDLPPFVKKRIDVALSPEQSRLYKEMKQEFITYLEGDAVVAELAITKALRLLQIVTGYVKFDTGEEKSLETPRKKALIEILEEITPGHKVLVWCVFKENYAQVRHVCEKLNIKYVEAHGGITNKKKYVAVDAFNKEEDIRVFIGHPGALGIGINLVPATYSVYYSRNFSLEQDIQSEARNYRGGSEIHDKVTRIDIVAKGTMDELVLEALENKMKVSETILKDWKKRL